MTNSRMIAPRADRTGAEEIAGKRSAQFGAMRKRRAIINTKFSVIMFDLGGVVIDCAPFSKLLGWQAWAKDLSTLDEKWDKSLAVREYHLGSISTKEFVENVIDEFDLNVSIARFIREFRLLPKGFYEGAEQLLGELRKNYTLACLSNINDLHWNKLCDVNKLNRQFTYNFASHLMHKSKPGEDIYKNAIKEMKTTVDKVVFFDDRPENVEAAQSLGITAFQTKGFDALREKLVELGIL